METLEIAQLKDDILKYLSSRNKIHILLREVYQALKIESMPIEVVQGYVEEMLEDDVITSTPMSMNRLVLTITNKGRKFLFEGGYVKRYNDELEKKLLEVDPEKYKEKTDLEIENLKASLDHYKKADKSNKTIITISLIALGVSIVFNILLLIF